MDCSAHVVVVVVVVVVKISGSQWHSGSIVCTASYQLNTGIVGSNPVWSMDVCLRFFCVSCVV
jgi:hypothetical protein